MNRSNCTGCHWVDLSHHYENVVGMLHANISIFAPNKKKAASNIPYFNAHLSKLTEICVIIRSETISVHSHAIIQKLCWTWVYWIHKHSVLILSCCNNIWTKSNFHLSFHWSSTSLSPFLLYIFSIVLLGTFLVFFNEIDQFSIWFGVFGSSLVPQPGTRFADECNSMCERLVYVICVQISTERPILLSLLLNHLDGFTHHIMRMKIVPYHHVVFN